MIPRLPVHRRLFVSALTSRSSSAPPPQRAEEWALTLRPDTTAVEAKQPKRHPGSPGSHDAGQCGVVRPTVGAAPESDARLFADAERRRRNREEGEVKAYVRCRTDSRVGQYLSHRTKELAEAPARRLWQLLSGGRDRLAVAVLPHATALLDPPLAAAVRAEVFPLCPFEEGAELDEAAFVAVVGRRRAAAVLRKGRTEGHDDPRPRPRSSSSGAVFERLSAPPVPPRATRLPHWLVVNAKGKGSAGERRSEGTGSRPPLRPPTTPLHPPTSPPHAGSVGRVGSQGSVGTPPRASRASPTGGSRKVSGTAARAGKDSPRWLSPRSQHSDPHSVTPRRRRGVTTSVRGERSESDPGPVGTPPTVPRPAVSQTKGGKKRAKADGYAKRRQREEGRHPPTSPTAGTVGGAGPKGAQTKGQGSDQRSEGQGGRAGKGAARLEQKQTEGTAVAWPTKGAQAGGRECDQRSQGQAGRRAGKCTPGVESETTTPAPPAKTVPSVGKSPADAPRQRTTEVAPKAQPKHTGRTRAPSDGVVIAATTAPAAAPAAVPAAVP
eukprot:Hpha_TRINITY_DN10570_c0_g1::TRINITY_DN10570_c0_g1_i3::g.31480::m.31480